MVIVTRNVTSLANEIPFIYKMYYDAHGIKFRYLYSD